jgi:hypothetical protein
VIAAVNPASPPPTTVTLLIPSPPLVSRILGTMVGDDWSAIQYQ